MTRTGMMMFDMAHEDRLVGRGLLADEFLEMAGQGIAFGTRIATTIGWRPVEAIAAGDQVLTFDHGMQPVQRVEHRMLWAGASTSRADWPLLVPVNVLGNRQEMVLLPGQSVLIESDLAEESFGDPFVLIPASVLDGHGGISRVRPSSRVEVVSLHFAREEVVFANAGAMFLCGSNADLLSAPEAQDGYTVLPEWLARDFIDCLE